MCVGGRGTGTSRFVGVKLYRMDESRSQLNKYF